VARGGAAGFDEVTGSRIARPWLVHDETDPQATGSADDFVLNGFYAENAAFFGDTHAGRRPSGDVSTARQSVEIMQRIRERRIEYTLNLGELTMIDTLADIARIRTGHTFGASNGGWAYDAYPELETLDAGRAITIANITGPAIITNIHTTQHIVPKAGGLFYQPDNALTDEQRSALAARGIILEIYYNDQPSPAVRVPLGDFFADGCGGRAQHFSTPFVEKAPESYNCFIPMPFEKSARVVLRNELPVNLGNYSFVEFERLPAWDDTLGYFHAAWDRFAFQLGGQTDHLFLHIDGAGHLIGRAWSVCTDEPLFKGFAFVMEGNNEVRIDGSHTPSADYLGTEDSFGFSWGFQRPYIGLYNGINYVRNDTPAQLSIYRFHHHNPIRFEKSLDWRIDWSHEFTTAQDFQTRLKHAVNGENAWIDYATTYYWYQKTMGYPHADLLSLAERVKPLLHSNQTS